MDSTAIKLKPEPCTSAEESVAVTCIKIEIDHPFIKEECTESIFENISGDVGTMEHSNIDGVAIKAELGIKDEEKRSITCKEIDIKIPEIEKECLEFPERILRTAMGASIGVKNSIQEKRRGSECTNSPPFTCSNCDRQLASKASLISHYLTHTKEKPFSCSYCNSSFSQKSILTRHMLTHTKEKPFSCSFCNYSCSRKSNLTEHTRSHTKEKPFSCSCCNYSCSHKSSLTRHMLTHTKEKPFPCSYCNYSSSQKSDLTRHELTHTKQKPFSCSY